MGLGDELAAHKCHQYRKERMLSSCSELLLQGWWELKNCSEQGHRALLDHGGAHRAGARQLCHLDICSASDKCGAYGLLVLSAKQSCGPFGAQSWENMGKVPSRTVKAQLQKQKGA